MITLNSPRLFCLALSAALTLGVSANSVAQTKILQHDQFIAWAKAKNAEVRNRDESLDHKPDKKLTPQEAYIKFNVPSPIELTAPAAKLPDKTTQKEIEQTAALYFTHFGRNTVSSFLWTGFETGNTLTKEMNYRWNSLREAGFYDPTIRARIIANLKKLGIKNLRFGFSNHEIFKNPDGTWNQQSWKASDEMIAALVNAGMKLSLDLHHFGIESQFCVDSQGQSATYRRGHDLLCDKSKYDPTKSFYLHKDWPDYFADFSLEAFRRYHTKVKAYTFINEPETVKGFNSGLWHGAFPGWLTPPHPTAGYYEAERAINIGKAAVKARLKIEEYIARTRMLADARPIYLHTEAIVPKPKWADFENYIRYITSDTILGADWVMDYNFAALAKASLPEVAKQVQWELTPPDKRTVLHMLTTQTIWWGFNDGADAQNARKTKFFKLIHELQTLHKQLQTRFGQSMRSYTVLGIDYYAHNEDKLEPRPELYITQIKSGERVGLFNAAKAYYDRYKMPLMVTESGTPYYPHGARWNQQMLLECAKLAMTGIPFLGYTLYPAIDTYGWEHAISRPLEPLYSTEGSLYNPSGLLFLHTEPPAHVDKPGFKALEPKPFIHEFMKQLKTHLRAG